MRQPVIAIFDVGKTNKKFFLFNCDYEVVYEETINLPETVDDDGDICEDLDRLQTYVFASLGQAFQNSDYEVKAVNFSTYGASFVHLGENGEPVTPLYNYLKSFPRELLNQFYDAYGGRELFATETASPVLGHLNSGLQLYWLKYCKRQMFNKIKFSLHLPQYMSFLLTGGFFSEPTSIGCHTNLWDFTKQQYHSWVYHEDICDKLAPIVPSSQVVAPLIPNEGYVVGVGLHDSSAALIPYLASFPEPFILISTGTWCISLNPFNSTGLTSEELQQDCLLYLSYEGKPVKASRLFAGNEHEQQTKKLSSHFGKPLDFYKSVETDYGLLRQLQKRQNTGGAEPGVRSFAERDLDEFTSYEEAYHQLIFDIVKQQVQSTKLVSNVPEVKRIFVDGGFSKNPIYMYLLASAFPRKEVFAASLAQATSLGAALAIHSAWNASSPPKDMVKLKKVSVRNSSFLKK